MGGTKHGGGGFGNSSNVTVASILNRQGSDASWTPPLWLTKEKQAPRPRSMTVPIPRVPAATRKAIAKVIASQRPPHYKEHAQMQQIHQKLLNQKEKAKNAQERLDRLEESKAERIQEIKLLREEEMKDALKKIKEDMERDHEIKKQKQEEEWKQTTEKEMRAAKRQFRKEQAELEEKETEEQKQKLEAQHVEAEKEQQEKKEEKAEGENEEKELLLSQKFELEYEKVKEKLAGLKEKKKEMVWLLKQVINAENKRKASDSGSSVPKKKMKL